VVHKTDPTTIATAQIRLLALFFIAWTMGECTFGEPRVNPEISRR
jgi:hypothetical protein